MSIDGDRRFALAQHHNAGWLRPTGRTGLSVANHTRMSIFTTSMKARDSDLFLAYTPSKSCFLVTFRLALTAATHTCLAPQPFPA
jgi:hypothetical protein